MRVAVSGPGGLLGRHLVTALNAAGHEAVALPRDVLDLEDPSSQEGFSLDGAGLFVHAAAWTDVDGCARDPERAMDLNGLATARIAARVAQLDALMLYVSTNEVFEGLGDRIYAEGDDTGPVNPYGASKLAGEAGTLTTNTGNVVVRTAWIHDSLQGFPTRIRTAAARGLVKVVDDEIGNPTPAADLAVAMVGVLERMAMGTAPAVLHLAGEPSVSRYGWASAVLAGSGAAVQPISSSEFSRASRAPRHAVLSTALAKSLGLPPLLWKATHAP